MKMGFHRPTRRERIAAALALAALGFGLYSLAHLEAGFKLFEFSFAPFMDKLLFGLSEE